MATRCYRSISRPSINLLKSTFSSSSPKPNSIPSSFSTTRLSAPSFPRSVSQLGCLQSLLPLHSAVSSARLTSGLAIDSRSSRSLSLGMLSSANPGV